MSNTASKSTLVTIDGVECALDKLPDGSLRVTHESQQVNPMHGPGTAGEIMYIVHPAQRQHFEFLNNLLPKDMQAAPSASIDNRPWWSYVPSTKENKARGND